MKTIVLTLVVISLVAAPGFAQMSPEYAEWPDGPASVLLSDGERADYAALSSDEQAEAFIALFWARRDPDLDTRRNEFKLEFDTRVVAADGQFGEAETRGALTDRGRVLLLLGVPEHHFSAEIGNFMANLYRVQPPVRSSSVDTDVEMHGVTFDILTGVSHIWEYTSEQIPESIDIGKRTKEVVFAFFDTNGTGDYRLMTTIRRATAGVDVLAALPAALILHPELDELPAFPLIAGADAATESQIQWLEAESKSWPEGAHAAVYQGVAVANYFPAWVFVALPKDVPEADVMVGRLVRADGGVEGTFQVPAAGLKTARGMAYELALPAPDGGSRLELALATGGQPIAVHELAMEFEEASSEGTYVSPVFGGGEVVKRGDYQAGEPFVFGGFHLVVRPDGVFDYSDELSYFGFVVRPGLGEDGKPAATIRMRLKYDGKQVSSAPPRPAELSEVAPDVFMFGSSLPLDFLPAGGEYAIRLTVEDTISGARRTTEIPFHMPDKE